LIPWVQLDSARTPDGAQELRLKRRGAEFSIMLGTNELMNSRLSGSEEALATLACERLAGRSSPRVLIGGLGMGFTLRAALAAFGADAAITIAELVPAVIAWARGPMSEIFDGCLDDPRVIIREADVGQLIKAQSAAWDAILLDVDNGPEGIVYKGNDSLYSAAGLGGACRLERRRRACGLVAGTGQRLHAAPEAGRLRGRGDQHARPWQTWRPPRDLDRNEGSLISCRLYATSPKAPVGRRFHRALRFVTAHGAGSPKLCLGQEFRTENRFALFLELLGATQPT